MYNKDIYPYVVVGDGIVSTDRLAARQLKDKKIRLPIPTIMYAKTLSKAEEIADDMKPWNDTVLICEVKHVAQ